MKKCLTLPFLLMAFVAFAQPKIHSITSFQVGKEKQKNVQLFDYQDNGLTVRRQNWDYKRVDSTPRLLNETLQRFTINGQLVSQEDKIPKPSGLETVWKIENTIDQNGCQTERRYTSLDKNKPTRVITYSTKTNIRCRILEETLRKYELNRKGELEYDSFDIVKKFEYDSRDSLTKISFSYFDKGLISNNFSPGLIEYKRRADGKVTEIYGDNACEFCTDLLGSPYRIIYEYDSKGQVVLEKIYPSYGRGPKLQDSTLSAYNSKGKLSREVVFSYDPNGQLVFKKTSDYDYEYYCDDLLKGRTTRFESQDYFAFSRPFKATYKDMYTYTEGATCDKKDLLDFTIAPNPASFQAIISAEGLSSADYTLAIYSSAGALIHTYKVDYRTTTFDFSTANLVSGTYLVRLTNDKNSVSKKLIVVH
jgi:hypothetical protein